MKNKKGTERDEARENQYQTGKRRDRKKIQSGTRQSEKQREIEKKRRAENAAEEVSRMFLL